jgi:hypothetical protein
MQLADLANQLELDSSQSVPPFGAESIKMAQQLGPTAVPLLLDEIANRRPTAFLALEALRVTDANSNASIPPAERAEIYVKALRDNHFFNAWGHAGGHLTETAKALIALNEDATSKLAPLLSDQRPALLQGSRDATMSGLSGNRLCDYAWVFINEIKRRPYVYSEDPAERDQAIQALRDELNEKTEHE